MKSNREEEEQWPDVPFKGCGAAARLRGVGNKVNVTDNCPRWLCKNVTNRVKE